MTFLLAVAFLEYLAPIKVAEKPPHSGFQAPFKRVAGLPPHILDLAEQGCDPMGFIHPGNPAELQGPEAVMIKGDARFQRVQALQFRLIACA